MKQISFTKYDAAGNTFLVVEQSSTRVDRRTLGKISRRLCSASTGVGADGLLLIHPAPKADFALDIFNADGSWAERSGNGLRAAVAHVSRTRLRKKEWTIACQRESIQARIISRSAKQTEIRSQVGIPEFNQPRPGEGLMRFNQLPELKVAGKKYRYVSLSIGNSHLTIIVRTIPRNWIEIGKAISEMARFRRGVNIEFARVRTQANIEVRVYERGVGPTASSGTGAAAALASLRVLGKVNRQATVEFSSEKLSAHWENEMVSVSGPVKLLFSGESPL